jgi:hypothetical protein
MRRLLWSRSRRSLKPPYPSMASVEREVRTPARRSLPGTRPCIPPTPVS